MHGEGGEGVGNSRVCSDDFFARADSNVRLDASKVVIARGFHSTDIARPFEDFERKKNLNIARHPIIML